MRYMIIITIIVTLLLISNNAMAYTNDQIANAIFKAEGGDEATYLYGIRSVEYKDKEDARRICINTIKNNRKRYEEYGYKTHDTYLSFLAARYAPIGCDNDTGTNKYWLRNVEYFLKNGE